MNATRSQLTAQYNRAKKLGWIPHFLAAEKQHTKGYFDAADLMGIGSRETNLDPKWLTKAGDGGHGYGLMQADDRSFPGWIDTGEWKKAESGIHKGAEILMMKWHDMDQNAGKTLKVKGNTFKSPKLSGFKAQQAVISSYNCGRWALYCAAKGYDVDRYTTGKDYSSDVIGRAAIFRELLRNDGLTDSTATSSATSTPNKNSIENSEQTNPPSTDQPSNVPVPLIPTPQPVIEVEAVSAAPATDKPEQESELTKIGNKANAAYTAFGSLISGAIAWFSGSPVGIVASVMGCVALLGTAYMAINAWRGDRKDKRDADARLERERRETELAIINAKHAQEVQMIMLRSAADPTLNAVKVVSPPVTTLPNADTAPETPEGQ